MKIHEMSLQDCRDEQKNIRLQHVRDINNLKKARDIKIEMLDKRIVTINEKGIKKRMKEAINSKKRR